MKVGIVIPTLNRTEFLLRQLSYYKRVACPHGIYIGDSSEPAQAQKLQEVVQSFSDSLNIYYEPYPHLNDMQTINALLKLVKEPYAAFVADDDFLCPNGLTQCAEYLSQHSDHSVAHGKALLCGFAGPHTQQFTTGPYPMGSLYGETASKRLVSFYERYFVPLFSVHRTEEFIQATEAAWDIPDKAFRELLPCGISAVQGNVKELDCLYLIRQTHPQRYVTADIFDWLTGEDWALSFGLFQKHLTEALVVQEGLSVEQAQEVVKEAFWMHLLTHLQRIWAKNYGSFEGDTSMLDDRVAALVRRFLGHKFYERVKYHVLQMKNRQYTLPGLRKTSSPYYKDFLPIYQTITEPIEWSGLQSSQ